ncbi:MAG TPA: RNA polymerase sigma-70 factor [Chitinophagaceae bacterium]|nr:RNA polymerase sigma-70 factor [Chitinophagaceae bacterium]
MVAAGDEHAFERLFFAFKDRVYEIGFIYTESAMLAEEIVQDVFVRIWVKRAELPAVKNFPAWVFTVAKNQAFNVLRNRVHRQRAMDELVAHVPAEAAPADEKLHGAQTRRLIAEAMDLLPPQQRQVFQLIRLEGHSREETARIMGLSPNTVKVHLNIGLKIIRAYLLKNGGYFPLVIFLYRCI